MRALVCVLLGSLCVPAAWAGPKPRPAVLADQLAFQMSADQVQVNAITFERVRSRVLFPIKAGVYSMWNGEIPVRMPDFYQVKFTARKGDAAYAFRCVLRSYDGSHVGAGYVSPALEYVMLADECRVTGATPPEETGLILSREAGGEQVLFYVRGARL